MQDSSKKKTEQKISLLNRYQQIVENSVEWGKIEYRLRMSFANVAIKNRKVYSIGNAINESRFMAKHEDKVILDFIVNPNQLSNHQDFTTICQKGFTEIIQLSYGQLDLSKARKENDQFYEVMYCRVAIGQTFIFQAKNKTESVPMQEKPQMMTPQFDSLFLYDENQVSKQFRQNYVIYKANENILPLYIVHFMIDETKYRGLQQSILCDNCQANRAEKYCETEQSYFCIECDNSHHINKISQKHKRFDLKEMPKVVGMCSFHQNIKLELFCLECNRPLCVNCRIKGDHSSGEMLMHQVIHVNQRYIETSKLIREADPNLDKKKKLLAGLVTAAETKLKDINRKSNEIQDKLTQILQRALKQLESITKQKMSQLMSDHIELKRQLDEIQWMDRFIAYQHRVLSPDDFLLSWERHMIFRKNSIANTFVPTKVLPNMRVEGYVSVTTDEESRKGDQQKSRVEEIERAAMFKKSTEDKNALLLKSKITSEDVETEAVAIKSKSNLLNLSILKHL